MIAALVILLILTVLGISGMQSTVLEERMAGNARDRNLAFQASEAALREGETYLAQQNIDPFDGTNGLYHVDDAPAPAQPAVDANWPSGAVAYSGNLAGAIAAPEYIIEELNAIPDTTSSLEAGAALPDVRLYRVTSRGEGQTPGTAVVLQTVYRR